MPPLGLAFTFRLGRTYAIYSLARDTAGFGPAKALGTLVGSSYIFGG